MTARRRTERLQDVPIAISSLTGDFIKEQQMTSLSDVAAFVPSLAVNSDSVGRAFVSMRGIGVTVIDEVQPGVGIFIDGVYQPNTTSLRSPLVDVERVEIMRGPQGTFFGNNTLGGAINIITRQPGDKWAGRADASFGSGDGVRSLSGTMSGPIIGEQLQLRVAAAYHTERGFGYDTLSRGPQNPLTSRSLSTTLRYRPTTWATLTANGSYDRVYGGNVGYFTATGPTDYRLRGQTNELSRARINYYAANLKGELDLGALRSKVTTLIAYNESRASSNLDLDFTPIDFLRERRQRQLTFFSGEVRAETTLNSHVSILLGAFTSKLESSNVEAVIVVPISFTTSELYLAKSSNQSVFGNLFLNLNDGLDIDVGARFDHQSLSASSAGSPAQYKTNQLQPRFAITRHWNPNVMSYASVARGSRSGGPNGPGAPNPLYKGDSVWTYEVGTKISSGDRRIQASATLFYNDYRDYIGPNALTPSTVRDPATGQPAGYVVINLNVGRARTYGLEAEFKYQIANNVAIYSNLTFLNARVTDSSAFLRTAGYPYPGDHIPFVPSLTYTAGVNFRPPLPGGNHLLFDANIVGKGRRFADSLDIESQPFLEAYELVNASIGWQDKYVEVAAFAANLFDQKYIESYLDKSLSARAGVPDPFVNNLVIQGTRRRIGIRGTYRF